ncbi:hypothetical protein KY345_01200 [Candidatus Woesearchaeota archaeon]|nr:hypothetical protein [Candidatus Woesearchaeota archaeon]
MKRLIDGARNYIKKIEQTPMNEIPLKVTRSYVNMLRPLQRPALNLVFCGALLYAAGLLLCGKNKTEFDGNINGMHTNLETVALFGGQAFNHDYLMEVELTSQNQAGKELVDLLDKGSANLNLPKQRTYSLVILDDERDRKITTDSKGYLNMRDYIWIKVGDKKYRYTAFTNWPDIIKKTDLLYRSMIEDALNG